MGLATLPDVLETRSASAQADYDLQAAIGATEIAHGDLATALGISPLNQFQVESIQNIKMPDSIAETVETYIDKALGTTARPDAAGCPIPCRRRGGESGSAGILFPKLSIDGPGWSSRFLRTAAGSAADLFANPGALGRAAHLKRGHYLMDWPGKNVWRGASGSETGCRDG